LLPGSQQRDRAGEQQPRQYCQSFHRESPFFVDFADIIYADPARHKKTGTRRLPDSRRKRFRAERTDEDQVY
ncbi:MAG: hypothetical protein ACREEM_46395, partial [Blastocatellia bacterium]